MNFKLFKKKYLVLYVSRDKGNIYNTIRKEYIQADTTNLDIDKDKTIVINTEYPSFENGLTKYFLVDILKHNVLYFKDAVKPILDAEVYNRIVRKEFFLQATSNLDSENQNVNWTWLIVGLCIGALAGIITGTILGGVFILQTMI